MRRCMAQRVSHLVAELESYLGSRSPEGGSKLPAELSSLESTAAALRNSARSGQLEASKQRNESALWRRRCDWFEQSLPMPVFELDAAGDFLSFNRVLADLLNCSPTLDCQLSWRRAVHEDDYQQVSHYLAAGLRRREPFELTVRLDSRFSGPRRLAFSVVPRLEGKSQLTGWIGFGRDESALAAQTELLERTESQRRLTIESTTDAYMTLDGQGQVLEFNPAAEQLFGCRRGETVGRQVLDLGLPTQLTLPLRGMLARWSALESDLDQELFESLCRDRLEVRPAGNDGPILNVEISSTRPDSLHRFYVTVVARDVTQDKQREAALMKAKEAAESASRMKSDFMARMSHEIRTPLNGIMAESELALEQAIGAEQAPWRNVKTAADQLLTIVNDVLDLSKIQAGKLSLHSEPFDFAAAMRDCVNSFQSAAEQKKLRLRLDLDERIPELLSGDAGRLRQVLMNLIGNAVKFTEQGYIQVAVVVRRATDKQVSLKFTVADTGVGIPLDKQQAIFDIFTQADASRTRKYGGLGLGLSIASLLVGMFNGRIWVESQPGHGSQFHFTLSLDTVGAATAGR